MSAIATCSSPPLRCRTLSGCTNRLAFIHALRTCMVHNRKAGRQTHGQKDTIVSLHHGTGAACQPVSLLACVRTPVQPRLLVGLSAPMHLADHASTTRTHIRPCTNPPTPPVLAPAGHPC
jgi:hypothetical protein